eukprot:comp17471_c1_seq1/m.16933 comp17471_c1_seq1/g.16933  ORF comp17471_c1_seq1/g.16933 comp17471_c1_seq1/m.16933 type:complete len:305 (-) comp17471_c1_seq1:143-1057(-)
MEKVNRTENVLSAARANYRQAILEGNAKLQAILRKSGVRSAVEKTEAFYLAMQTWIKGQEEARTVAAQYEKTAEDLEEAKQEQIAAMDKDDEAVFQASMKVMRLQMELEALGEKYQGLTRKINDARDRYQVEKDRAIYDPLYGMRVDRAEAYYLVKQDVERSILDAQSRLAALMEDLDTARKRYSTATRSIESLAIDIQTQRQSVSPSCTPCANSLRTPPNSFASSPMGPLTPVPSGNMKIYVQSNLNPTAQGDQSTNDVDCDTLESLAEISLSESDDCKQITNQSECANEKFAEKCEGAMGGI